MKKYICILLSILFATTLFSSCSDKEEAFDFIYPFSANVNSYDPQVASTADEFLIIENTFEGLVRVNDDGKIQKGMADSWQISQDGLTYTFNLKKGMKWDIKTEKYKTGEKKGQFRDSRLRMMEKEFNPDIMANDFVFALRRAVSKTTNCPLFSYVACIKNANAIHSGKAPESTLGVTAIDNYTLKIVLEHRDDTFMNTLASAVAMPCNEEFFNATKGRYGLDTKYTLFNGQFYVNQILESSYLLKQNDCYTGEHPTLAKELTLKIVNDETSRSQIVDKLESGYYDCAFIKGTDSDSIKKSSGVSYTEYTDTTWAFVFNTNDEIFQSKTMRKAFCQGFSRQKNYEKEYIKPATTLTPLSCEINGNNAVTAMGSTIEPTNTNESIANWKKALSILDTSEVEVIVLTPDYMEEYVKQHLQGIQSGLGAALTKENGSSIVLTLKVNAMPESEMKKAVNQGEYDIAFMQFNASEKSALAFLSNVADLNITDFNAKKVQNYIANAQTKSVLNETAKNMRAAEKAIINTYTICPMIYESSYYATAKGVNNVQFHAGTGRVSFVNATR